jgi:hypothetical protein
MTKMKNLPFVVCVLLLSVPSYAQPGSDITAADVFSLNMVGQTWVFRNSLGDTTTIDVQPSPYANCAVLFITKSISRAYWSPGSGGAKVQFEICQQSDGGWYSSRSIMSGDTDAGGHSAPWKSTSNVGLVPSMPQAYQIIPPSGSSHGTPSLISKFRNYNLNQMLTFADITQNPNATIADVSWKTDSFVGPGCVPYRNYCGNVLFITQLEHCTTPTDLGNGCIREKWGWAPGMGLISIDVLSASTTWDGLCTLDHNGVKRCYTFDQINIKRVTPRLN